MYPECQVDIWRSGRLTEHSSSRLWAVLATYSGSESCHTAVQKSEFKKYGGLMFLLLLLLFSTPPDVYLTSRYGTAHEKFYQAVPHSAGAWVLMNSCVPLLVVRGGGIRAPVEDGVCLVFTVVIPILHSRFAYCIVYPVWS